MVIIKKVILLAAADPGIPGGSGGPVGDPASLSQGIINPAINAKVGQGDGVFIINTFLNNFISIAFIIGGLVTFFFLITGGLGWITSGGDKEKMSKAQGRITQAVIGLALLLSVFAIAKLLGAIFGINLLTIDLTNILLE